MKKLKIFTILGLLTLSMAFGGLTSCGPGALAMPEGFEVDVENMLTWSDVESARSYTIEIKNVETGEIIESTARREYFSLAGLAIGNYEIRIKAIGGEKGVQSEWSEIHAFERLYESGCLYRLVNNSEYEITSKGSATGVVLIDGTYRDKPVTSIADSAFRKCWGMEEIIIKENIKTIGEGAFLHCKDLVSVVLPQSLTHIGASAFQDCNSLKNIEIPESVVSLSDYTFAYCKSLEEIKLHDKMTSLGEAVFLECRALQEIEIPDSVTEIRPYAFDSATALTTVKLGSGLTTIEEHAFSNCSSLQTILFSEEGNLESIGQRAFSDATAMTSITFPEGLVDLGYASFYGCSALETINLPDSLLHLSAFAFTGTKAYKDAWGADFVYIDDWLIACSNTIKGYNEEGKAYVDDEIVGLTELLEDTLRAGTVGIADEAFYGAVDLMRVALPSSMRAVGDYAFFKCPSLRGVSTNKVKHIGKYAFSDCKGLTQLVLGRGLETIDNYAFYNCTGVANNENYSIIPDTVKRIGTFAFKYTNLWGKPDEFGLVYAGNWVVGFNGKNPGAVELKEDTAGISDYAFYQCSTLQSIAGLSDVDYIGRGAFYECTSLALVSLGRGLKKIEDYTFYKCTSLSNVTLLGGVKEIGRSAFYKCGWLGAINLARCEVEKIGMYAFYGCTNLQSVNFGNSLVDIDSSAFYKCSALQTVTIPGTIKEIKDRVFYKCTALESVIFEEGVEKIGKYAFQGCSALKEVVLPDSLKVLDKSAFYKCSSVQTIRFGEGIETIGDYAFYGAESLYELYLPANVTVGKYAFKGCNTLSSLVLSKDVTSISDHAFYGCKQMTVYTDATNAKEAGWSDRWNSSYRPVVWGCVLSDDNTYVVSVTITEKTLENINAKYGFKAPEKDGGLQRAIGWATQENGEVVYGVNNLASAPIGTTLYPVWAEYKAVVLFAHNVDFSDYEGYTPLTKGTVSSNGKYTGETPVAPTNSGYVFGGYYVDALYTKEVNFAEAVIKRDTLVHIKWLTQEEWEALQGDGSQDSAEDSAAE